MKKNKFAKLLLLSLVSGILLAVPYIFPHCGIVALIAFLPLLAAEYIATGNKTRHFWICYYSAFLVWNIIATWWIWYATPAGSVAAIILNSLQMAIIFRLFRLFRKKAAGFFPYVALAIMWCAWEHLYQDWQVTWPWLNLGNAFAQSIKHIQWYEITGSIGGSFWILLVNVLVFNSINSYVHGKKSWHFVLGAIILIVVPITLSHIRYNNLGKQIANPSDKKEVVILQPNIDPYQDKFAGKTQAEQDAILLRLAEKTVTDSTFLTVAPETFFNPSPGAGAIYENDPVGNKTLDRIVSFATSHNTNFIFGAVTQKIYEKAGFEKPTRSAREGRGGIWWDVFNTAVFVNKNGSLDFYHKSKLVILAETVPYIGNKSILSSLGLDLGGGFGNFGTQDFRSVFTTEDGIKIGTAVCYESVFGNFFADYVREGANLMTIITNDGWWHNTSGHKQHLHYASLRAIETRRDIARSANTGISAIINQRGDIISPTQWWTECAVKGSVCPDSKLTYFVRRGDQIGKWCTYFFLLGALGWIVSLFIKLILRIAFAIRRKK